MNGGGFPMRFTELDGRVINTYQQHTHMHDEADQAYPATIDALLDNALGPNGYYGAFGTNIHHDFGAPQPMDEEIIDAAQERDVPLISYKQLLDWTEGRNRSSITELAWGDGSLTFRTTVEPKGRGLQTLLPTRGPAGSTLSGLTCGGEPRPYGHRTVKGLQYATFAAVSGTCRATYG
jgi:hypothetical protein